MKWNRGNQFHPIPPLYPQFCSIQFESSNKVQPYKFPSKGFECGMWAIHTIMGDSTTQQVWAVA
ncbi:hypothetical protein TSUD_113690 [Trifolium subterraneum]|uniref:Uncharacterized protein n=1 Tax=Trifolium subterraneum TaxID=3900 RepID=A0A2Z6MVQ1_TRISU|nr:hypothetical protein TSUD_113690 [Trifolium subterraneum]